MELDVTSAIEIIGQTPVVRMDQIRRLAQAHGLSLKVFLCAALEAAETIKIILGIGDPLRNRLLRLDLMRNEWHIFPIG